jgi:hypothetical protein
MVFLYLALHEVSSVCSSADDSWHHRGGVPGCSVNMVGDVAVPTFLSVVQDLGVNTTSSK